VNTLNDRRGTVANTRDCDLDLRQF